jgi:hypothetical protein
MKTVATALLLCQFVFLNIIVPGHTRGAVTLDGKHSGDVCCCCGGDAPANTNNPSQHTPSKKDRENCAICNFAARVTHAPVLNLKLPELGLLEVLPPPTPAISVSLAVIPTCHERAPPGLPSISIVL